MDNSDLLTAYKVAYTLAMQLLFGSDVPNPGDGLRMLTEAANLDVYFDPDFEGVIADAKTMARRLDDDDAPETTRWRH
jgi:hypothetical protein